MHNMSPDMNDSCLYNRPMGGKSAWLFDEYLTVIVGRLRIDLVKLMLIFVTLHKRPN